MQHSIDTRPAHVEGLPDVRKVPVTAAFEWLRLGAHDLRRWPGLSLAIGAVIASAGWFLVTAAWKAAYLAPALLGGFLLVAPFLGIGLYAMARQMERGEPLDGGRAWMAWRANAGSIALFGLMLVLAYIFWERSAAILFALHYEGQAVQVTRLPEELLLSRRFDGLLVTFMIGGATMAALVFAFSVVSAPLLLDRPADAITAVLTSFRCCLNNPGAMVVWAALIAGLTALGFATLMLGLVVIFPWLAFATWHAYRAMVAD